MDSGLARLSTTQKIAAATAALAAFAALWVPQSGGIFGQSTQPVYRLQELLIFALAAIAGIAAAIAFEPAERAAPESAPIDGVGRVALVAAAGMVIAMIAGLLLSPPALFWLVAEDGPAETVQATLLFGGALAALLAARGNAGAGHRGAAIWCAVLAVLLALIGFEEISWGQRIFGIETPEWLAERNQQGETNLHNMATGPAEYFYYIGAFTLMVVARALKALRRPDIDRLLPALPVLAIGVLGAGLSFEMWPYALMVLAFAVGAGFAVVTIRIAREAGQDRRALWLGAVLALAVLAQLVLMGLGHRMVRTWDNDEVRETLIAIGLSLYAWQLYATLRRERLSLSATRP